MSLRAAVAAGVIAAAAIAGAFAIAGYWGTRAVPNDAPVTAIVTQPTNPPIADPASVATTTPPASGRVSNPADPAGAGVSTGSAGEPIERIVTLPAVGRATAYLPPGATARAVLFLSAAGGLTSADAVRARALAARAVVVALSFDALKKAQGSVRCWFPAGVLEDIAKSAEGQLGWNEPHPPLLVGEAEGAALAYASFAQAPAGTYSGVVTIGGVGPLPTKRPLCATPTWKSSTDTPITVASVPLDPRIAPEWTNLNSVPVADAEIAGTVDRLFAASEHPNERAEAPTASTADMQKRLDALKLSLDYVWSAQPKASMIFISGDGGWKDIDRKLAAYVGQRGVNVVGLSSLLYFFRKKSPAQASADLARMIDVVQDAHVPIFIGGYSFGADVVPLMIEGVPPDKRALIHGEILIATSPAAAFQLDPLGFDWMPFSGSRPKSNAPELRVADAVRRLRLPTFCLSGLQVPPTNTACSALGDIATVVRLPGDHHFNGRYDAIGEAVMTFIHATLPAAR